LLERITHFLVASGPWAILLIAFIDSAGIPLTAGTDVLVVLLCVKQPHLAILWAALAVLGSSAGNLTLYFMANKTGQRMLKVEAPEGLRPRFRKWFHRYGLVTLFIPALVPFPPMPMKFFVACSGVFCVPIPRFLLTILLARILRYGTEAYLGVQMGEHSTAYLKQHQWDLAIIAGLIGIGLYLLVRLADGRRSAS